MPRQINNCLTYFIPEFVQYLWEQGQIHSSLWRFLLFMSIFVNLAIAYPNRQLRHTWIIQRKKVGSKHNLKITDLVWQSFQCVTPIRMIMPQHSLCTFEKLKSLFWKERRNDCILSVLEVVVPCSAQEMPYDFKS